jgi:hypothetical protein
LNQIPQGIGKHRSTHGLSILALTGTPFRSPATGKEWVLLGCLRLQTRKSKRAKAAGRQRGRKYCARQRSHRVALRGPAGRTSCDGCCSPSSVVDLGRLRDLRRFVDWFCDMAQNSPMTCEKITPSASKPVLGGCCFTCQELVDGTYILYQGSLSHERAELTRNTSDHDASIELPSLV